MAVYVSNKPAVVSRIGEIILLPNEANSQSDKPFDARNPWEYFVVATDWSFSAGMYSNALYGNLFGIKNILKLNVNDWDVSQVKKISDWNEDLNIACIQQNENNGFQAFVTSGAKLAGVGIGKTKDIPLEKQLKLMFSIISGEMVYNR